MSSKGSLCLCGMREIIKLCSQTNYIWPQFWFLLFNWHSEPAGGNLGLAPRGLSFTALTHSNRNQGIKPLCVALKIHLLTASLKHIDLRDEFKVLTTNLRNDQHLSLSIRKEWWDLESWIKDLFSTYFWHRKSSSENICIQRWCQIVAVFRIFKKCCLVSKIITIFWFL